MCNIELNPERSIAWTMVYTLMSFVDDADEFSLINELESLIDRVEDKGEPVLKDIENILNHFIEYSISSVRELKATESKETDYFNEEFIKLIKSNGGSLEQVRLGFIRVRNRTISVHQSIIAFCEEMKAVIDNYRASKKNIHSLERLCEKLNYVKGQLVTNINYYIPKYSF